MVFDLLLVADSASSGAEAAEVVGDGLLVAGGHGVGIGAADLTGPLAVLIAAQLELERVEPAQQPLVELLDHRRVAGEAAKIQVLHLADQFLDLPLHLGIARGLSAKLVQFVQALLNGLLGIARRGCLAWRPRRPASGIVAGIEAAVLITAGAGRATRADVIPDTSALLPVAALPGLRALVSLRALLARLARLTVAAQRSWP